MNADEMQPEPPGFSLLYITCPDKAVADKLGTLIVSEKLAACANVISGMTSIYPWKGQIAQGDEVVLLLKTQKACVAAAMARIEGNHPYDVPAIMEIPLGRIAAPYEQWLLQETAQQPS